MPPPPRSSSWFIYFSQMKFVIMRGCAPPAKNCQPFFVAILLILSQLGEKYEFHPLSIVFFPTCYLAITEKYTYIIGYIIIFYTAVPVVYLGLHIFLFKVDIDCGGSSTLEISSGRLARLADGTAVAREIHNYFIYINSVIFLKN